MSASCFLVPRIRFASWVLPLAALWLAACGSGSGPATSAGPPVPAPVLAVGDHWQYRITDNLRRGAVTILDAEVASISGGVASLRLTYTDPLGARSEKTEEVNASGALVVGTLKEELTRRYPTPIELFDFPLQAGTSWRQVVDTTSPDTGLPAQILVFGTVQGSTQVTVPAGTFDTVYLFRVIQLDDAQFWRTRTDRRDFVWFAPQAKGVARETRDASYNQIGGGALTTIRTENTTRELLSFRPGSR